ncbi:hypothetical protein AAHA92_31450 [Salvia divinorum]|uniref:Uncharacterized protein n=1 Tax=Salvia divinorum TaxID=28513 RepID=A0ABD1FQW1_SALDI
MTFIELGDIPLINQTTEEDETGKAACLGGSFRLVDENGHALGLGVVAKQRVSAFGSDYGGTLAVDASDKGGE